MTYYEQFSTHYTTDRFAAHLRRAEAVEIGNIECSIGGSGIDSACAALLKPQGEQDLRKARVTLQLLQLHVYTCKSCDRFTYSSASHAISSRVHLKVLLSVHVYT